MTASHAATMVEHTQRRLAQEMHDGLCQSLTGATLLARSLANALSDVGHGLAKEAHSLCELLAKTSHEARDLARGLHPHELDHVGLEAALSTLAKQTAKLVPCEFHLSGDGPSVPPQQALQCYRIAQESVHNALKHARSKRLHLSLQLLADHAILEVMDDGDGFDLVATRQRAEGLGLYSLEQRAMAVGGKLEIKTAPQKGTRVRLEMPRQAS